MERQTIGVAGWIATERQRQQQAEVDIHKKVAELWSNQDFREQEQYEAFMDAVYEGSNDDDAE